MEMDVKGVSQCPEPIPHAQGSGGCQQQQRHDGQAGEPAGDSSQPPEKRQSGEKEDRKRFTLKSSGVH